MPIKQVDAMPDDAKGGRKDKRAILSKEILDAIRSKIPVFEITSEDYSDKQLPSRVREIVQTDVLKDYVMYPIYDQAIRDGLAGLGKIRGDHSKSYLHHRNLGRIAPKSRNWIRVKSVVEDGRTRVYCEVDYDMLEKFKRDLYEYLMPDSKYDNSKPLSELGYKLPTCATPDIRELSEKNKQQIIKDFDGYSSIQKQYAASLGASITLMEAARARIIAMLNSGEITREQYDSLDNSYYQITSDYHSEYDEADAKQIRDRLSLIILKKIMLYQKGRDLLSGNEQD